MTEWKRWTDPEIAKLLALRARGDNWDDIAREMRRTPSACQVQFGKHRPAGTSKKRRAMRTKQAPLAPVIAVLQAAPGAPSARRVSTAVLLHDAELRARIALQGLTAGLLGDPLPGRSALDERKARGQGGGNG